MMKLITGKYFNQKEKIVECFTFLIKDDFIQDEKVVANFQTTCCQQIQKVSGHYNDYKNLLIKYSGEVFAKPVRIQSELVTEFFDCLIVELTENLDRVVAQAETSILAEQKGSFFQFDEKREEDQHTLQTIDDVYKSMPKLMS